MICIPNEWKFAVVTPLYKGKGEYSEFNSYRGISVLLPLAKIFERVLQYQILDYFNRNNYFFLNLIILIIRLFVE